MTAVWLVVRAGLRARWRSWLALALVAGVAGGLVSAVAAGARRTDAAYPALVAWSRPPDDLISIGFGQTFADLPAATIARLPQVTVMATLTSYSALEPASVVVYASSDATVPGTLWRRKLLVGRLPDPASAAQADISFTVARAEHVGVGGTLRLMLLGAGGKPVPFTFQVVGIEAAPGDFPPQSGTDLGTGAELTVAGLTGMAPHGLTVPPYSALVVTFRASAPAAQASTAQQDIAALTRRLDALGPYAVSAADTPADLVNFGQVEDLPLLLGLALGAAALLTLAHLLLTAASRRRRDLAVLRVLGLTGRQVRATVSWMAVAVALAALAAGVPVGIACGRLAWEFFAGQLGVQPVTEVPAAPFGLLVASGVALAVAMAALPGAQASRARPADVLRAE